MNNNFFKIFNLKFKGNRDYEIYLKRNNGSKFVDIAKEYNLTISRIQQICEVTKEQVNTFYTDYYKMYGINI